MKSLFAGPVFIRRLLPWTLALDRGEQLLKRAQSSVRYMSENCESTCGFCRNAADPNPSSNDDRVGRRRSSQLPNSAASNPAAIQPVSPPPPPASKPDATTRDKQALEKDSDSKSGQGVASTAAPPPTKAAGGVSACFDRPGYSTSHGHTCRSWRGYSCLQAELYGYSEAETAELAKACVASCRLCDTGLESDPITAASVHDATESSHGDSSSAKTPGAGGASIRRRMSWSNIAAASAGILLSGIMLLALRRVASRRASTAQFGGADMCTTPEHMQSPIRHAVLETTQDRGDDMAWQNWGGRSPLSTSPQQEREQRHALPTHNAEFGEPASALPTTQPPTWHLQPEVPFPPERNNADSSLCNVDSQPAPRHPQLANTVPAARPRLSSSDSGVDDREAEPSPRARQPWPPQRMAEQRVAPSVPCAVPRRPVAWLWTAERSCDPPRQVSPAAMASHIWPRSESGCAVGGEGGAAVVGMEGAAMSQSASQPCVQMSDRGGVVREGVGMGMGGAALYAPHRRTQLDRDNLLLIDREVRTARNGVSRTLGATILEYEDDPYRQ